MKSSVWRAGLAGVVVVMLVEDDVVGPPKRQ